MCQCVTETDLEYIKHINPNIFKYVCLGYVVILSYFYYL